MLPPGQDFRRCDGTPEPDSTKEERYRGSDGENRLKQTIARHCPLRSWLLLTTVGEHLTENMRPEIKHVNNAQALHQAPCGAVWIFLNN